MKIDISAQVLGTSLSAPFHSYLFAELLVLTQAWETYHKSP